MMLAGFKLELWSMVDLAPFDGKMQDPAQYSEARIDGAGLQRFALESIRPDVGSEFRNVLSGNVRQGTAAERGIGLHSADAGFVPAFPGLRGIVFEFPLGPRLETIFDEIPEGSALLFADAY